MVDFLAEQKINILLCIGGDGTLRGAQEIAKEVQKRGLNTAVVAIPKTIDNDVMYISRTFGMITATEKAHEILDCAHSEARSAYNGVGLVKLSISIQVTSYAAFRRTATTQSCATCWPGMQYMPRWPAKRISSSAFGIARSPMSRFHWP